jgi:hypothetical protein
MMENDGEEMERVVSTRLYGDSKYKEYPAGTGGGNRIDSVSFFVYK